MINTTISSSGLNIISTERFMFKNRIVTVTIIVPKTTRFTNILFDLTNSNNVTQIHNAKLL